MAVTLAVLTDCMLLQFVLSFQPGVPRVLLKAELEGYISLSETERYKLQHDDTYSAGGLWLRYALLTKTFRIEELVFRLRRQRYYADHPLFALDDVLTQVCTLGMVTHLESLSQRSGFFAEWPEDLAKNVLQHYCEVFDQCEKPVEKLRELQEMIHWLYENHPETFIAKLTVENKLLFHEDEQTFLEFLLRTCRAEVHVSLLAESTVPIVQLVASTHPEQINARLVNYACAQGNLDVLQWLHSSPQFTDSGIFTVAAMDSAASAGNLEVLGFLHTHRTEGCTSAAIGSAMWIGSVETVKFFLEQRGEHVTPMAVNHVVQNNLVDIVACLVRSGVDASWSENEPHWPLNEAADSLRRVLEVSQSWPPTEVQRDSRISGP